METDLPWDVPSAERKRALWSDDEQNADCDEQPTERWHGRSVGAAESKMKRQIAPSPKKGPFNVAMTVAMTLSRLGNFTLGTSGVLESWSCLGPCVSRIPYTERDDNGAGFVTLRMQGAHGAHRQLPSIASMAAHVISMSIDCRNVRSFWVQQYENACTSSSMHCGHFHETLKPIAIAGNSTLQSPWYHRY